MRRSRTPVSRSRSMPVWCAVVAISASLPSRRSGSDAPMPAKRLVYGPPPAGPSIPPSRAIQCRSPLVVIEAPPGLPAEPPGGDHALHQGRGCVLVPLEFLIERIAHRVQDVEADEIAQCERTHRVPGPELHPLVDVLPGGE